MSEIGGHNARAGQPKPLRVGLDLDEVILRNDNELMPGALEGMRKIKDMAEVFIITAASPMVRPYKERVLAELGVPYTALICALNKGLIARGLDLHYFVDDFYDHCRQVSQACPGAQVRIFPSPGVRFRIPDIPYLDEADPWNQIVTEVLDLEIITFFETSRETRRERGGWD